jgi:hypothetical protein
MRYAIKLNLEMCVVRVHHRTVIGLDLAYDAFDRVGSAVPELTSFCHDAGG